MKILRCYVENFGVISKESFDFDENLSCIYKENGKGKTTLFVFIKAMLFSLEATTRRALDENERNKYRPWNGGVFGGWLEFSSETRGASYRVTRFFGEKESLDTFEIIDISTGLDAKDCFEGQNIGASLLNIDADGFERTLFLSERDLEIKNSGSITQKISALASGEDESFENAVKILDNKRKYYKNNQNRGYLVDLEEKLSQKNLDLEELLIKSENIKRLEDELLVNNEKLCELSEGKKALENKIEAISNALMVKNKQKSEKALAERLEKLTLEKQRVCEKYINGGVTDSDAKAVQEGIDGLKKLLAQRGSDQSAELKAKIHALEARLGDTDITKEEIPSLIKKYSEAQGVDLELFEKQSQNALLEYENCQKTLPKEPFDENELEKAKEIKEKIARLEGEKNALTDKFLTLSRQNEGNESKNTDKKAFWALCMTLACAVSAVFALILTPWLWIAFALTLGASVVLGAGALKARAQGSLQKQSLENEKSELDEGIQSIKAQIDALLAQSEEILRKYASFGGIFDIKERFARLEQLRIRRDELSIKYQSEKARVERIVGELSQRLLPYDNGTRSADIGQTLIALSGDLERLEHLRSDLDAQNRQQKSINEQIFFAQNELFDLINSLLVDGTKERDVDSAQRIYNTMLLDISALPRLENEISQLQGALDSAGASTSVDNFDQAFVEMDENRLSRELDTAKNGLLSQDEARENVRAVIGRLESALEVLYDRCEDIPAIEQEIAELEEKQRAASEEFTVVVKTKELLEKAKNSLVSRYLGAIRDNFADIFCKITSDQAENVKLDAKLALKFEREGALRDMQYFSRGMRDIMDFSLRMALVKTLFDKEEAPFILLDDPFASLDEKHLEIAKKCVSEIASEYQIVYAVCSEDRKI